MDTDQKISTKLAHLGSEPISYHGVVNTPVHRASTFVFKTFAEFQDCFNAEYRYGREATPTSRAFERAITGMHIDGYGSLSTSSGLAAIIAVLMSFSKNNSHILVPDNLYGFARGFCDETLSKLGVEVEYYDPMIGSDIENMIKNNTSLIYLESPGSLTYEVQDLKSFVKIAKKHNIVTAIDNSWATPINLQPFEIGIDISIMSATKYISGHSDAMLGVCTCAKKEHYELIQSMIRQLGNCAGSEELYLALRGLRTLSIRMEQHTKSGLELANWLSTRDEVNKVLHPALPSCQGHEFWKENFKGASGVFAILLKETNENKIGQMLDSMKIFKMGFSWGGYESLLFPEQPHESRTAKKWEEDGFLMRIHSGLEDIDDLKQDIELGFSRL